MSGHDRYEALAGAVMLGEATAAERAEFDAHAAGCAACRDDAQAGLATVASISRSRDAETWRPSVPVMATIRERSQRRFRWTLGAFGWAVGASLVLNIALVGGVGNGLVTRLSQPPGESSSGVAATTITEDAPHPHVAEAGPAEADASRAAVALAKPAPKAASVARSTRALTDTHAVARQAAAAATDDVPDLLAGLDLDGSLDRRAVALERARCRHDQQAAGVTVAAESEAAPAGSNRPCATPPP